MVKERNTKDNTLLYLAKLESFGFDISSLDKNIKLKNKNRINIKCKLGHDIESTVFNLLIRKKCTRCNKIKPYLEFSKILESEGYKIITKVEEFDNCKERLLYICPNNHKYGNSIHHIREGKRCKHCANEKLSKERRATEDSLKMIFEIENYKVNDDLSSYVNEDSRFSVTCPNNHTYDVAIGNFKSGYRCRVCFEESNIGENHPSWNGGISDLNNYLRTNINKWKIDSLVNSNYICFITGINGELHVHHHVNFSKIITEVMDNLNLSVLDSVGKYTSEELNLLVSEVIKKHYDYGLGIVLLKDIHILFHSIYGKFNNNMEQVLEFKQDYLNGKYDDVLPENLKSTTTQK